MNPFESLPDELIVAHCEELDAVSLAKLSEAYERVYYVCKDILERKKDVYQLNKRVRRIVEDIKNSPDVILYGFDLSEILFDIDKSFRDFYDRRLLSPNIYGLPDDTKVKMEIQIRYGFGYNRDKWAIYGLKYYVDANGVNRQLEFFVLGVVEDILGFIGFLIENGIEPHAATRAEFLIPF